MSSRMPTVEMTRTVDLLSQISFHINKNSVSSLPALYRGVRLIDLLMHRKWLGIENARYSRHTFTS
jgi:hypothetical protein